MFVILSILISPKIKFDSNNITSYSSPIIKADSISFLGINNSHYKVLNQFMVLLTNYGREVFWAIAIILLFVLGGWTGLH
jgi:hypothetical protein